MAGANRQAFGPEFEQSVKLLDYCGESAKQAQTRPKCADGGFEGVGKGWGIDKPLVRIKLRYSSTRIMPRPAQNKPKVLPQCKV